MTVSVEKQNMQPETNISEGQQLLNNTAEENLSEGISAEERARREKRDKALEEYVHISHIVSPKEK